MISLSGMVIQKFSHTTSHQMILYVGILFIHKSLSDIWNSNANINVISFDDVFVERNNISNLNDEDNDP